MEEPEPVALDAVEPEAVAVDAVEPEAVALDAVEPEAVAVEELETEAMEEAETEAMEEPESEAMEEPETVAVEESEPEYQVQYIFIIKEMYSLCNRGFKYLTRLQNAVINFFLNKVKMKSTKFYCILYY